MTYVNSGEGALKFYLALVFGNPISCLRDTGATTVIIDKTLVELKHFINDYTTLKMANSQTITCPKAIIELERSWFSGKVKATVMENAVCPLIIGNIPGVSDDVVGKSEKWKYVKNDILAAVVTRNQSKLEGEK